MTRVISLAGVLKNYADRSIIRVLCLVLSTLPCLEYSKRGKGTLKTTADPAG